MHIFRLLMMQFCLFYLAAFAHTQPLIKVIYPNAGQRVMASDSTFIYGSVTPSNSKLYINTQNVSVYPNGAFLAMIPVEAGNFVFRCTAIYDADTSETDIPVYIPRYITPIPADTFMIDTSYIYPDKHFVLFAGDELQVAMKGTPGCSAVFSISGVADNLPMTEILNSHTFNWYENVFGKALSGHPASATGMYVGSYTINNWDWAANAAIAFKLINDKNETVEASAAGTLSIEDDKRPLFAIIAQTITAASSAPGGDGLLVLPEGCSLPITRRYGEHVNIQPSEAKNVWLEASEIQLSQQTGVIAEAAIRGLQTKSGETNSQVTILLSKRIPFEIKQTQKPPELVLTLFGLQTKTDWSRDVFDPVVEALEWEQPGNDKYQLKIKLKSTQLWGYSATYERNNLLIKIKHPPQIAGWPNSPLRGIIFTLDPAHGPEPGATGPTGLTEKEATLQVCERLKRKLERKGAFVYLTRENEHGIDVPGRVAVAEFISSDVLLSLHFNSLPDGVNPHTNRGTSTYYYHPMNYKLAHIIQQTMLNKLKLQDYGLFFQDLPLTKPTSMLSILIKPAFITYPEEELLIRSVGFQETLADALVEAFELFFSKLKE